MADKYKTNSYFPVGTSVEQAVAMVEEAILNPVLIECTDIASNGKKTFNIVSKSGQKFRMYVENNVVKYHPLSPFAN